MNDTFEQWWQGRIEKHKVSALYPEKDNARAAWDYQQAKLDAQAEELAALRGFCNALLGRDIPVGVRVLMQVHRLVDKDFNPTPLLTGEKE